MSIIVMLILVVLSGYFSATETAFSSLSRTKLKSMVEDGDKRAERALIISEDYDRLLSAILVGNNIVNIGLASIATIFFIDIAGETYGATLSTVIVTIIVLIFGEVSPKSLAKENPESFAMAVAPSISIVIVVFTPATAFFSAWKKLLSRIFKINSDRRVTHSELLTLVNEVEQEGVFDKEESDLLRNAIEFNDLEAEDILTPRVDIESVSADASFAEISQAFTQSGYSRLPVYVGSIDRIIGVINQKDFYAHTDETDEKPTERIIKDPLFITPSTKLSALLRQLQRTKSHMAVVADEYGGTMGIVTMEDILEELVGEIWDEHDEIIEEFQKIEEDKFKIICSAELYKLFDFFSKKGEPESATVSGWVMEMLGHFPEEGDTFTYEDLFVTVIKTDRQRILEITVEVMPETDEK